MKISVAMAVYNGEKFLGEQLDSILCQIGPLDEVIISVDPSGDGSSALVSAYAGRDERVKMVAGEGRGLIRNFENAISHCTGDVIFMADQDDVWISGKTELCMKCFEDVRVMAVLHDAVVCSADLSKELMPSFFAYKNCRNGIVRNVLKNSYMGCCMAFRKELLNWVLPFPKRIPMHDQWIGLMAEKHGKTVFLQEKLLKYRRHKQNKSAMHHAGIFQMLIWRLQIIGQLIIRN